MALKYIATDVESTGLYPYGSFEDWGFYPARPFAWTFCDEKGKSTYVRAEVDPFTREVLPLSKGDRRVIRDVYEDDRIAKVFHNPTFDIRMNRFAGYEIRGRVEDTLALIHVVTGGNLLTYGLKGIGSRFFDISDQDERKLKDQTNAARRYGKRMGWCLGQSPFHGKEAWKSDTWLPFEDLDELCEIYCNLDGYRTMVIWLTVAPDLEENEGLKETYEREMRLRPAIQRIEDRGVRTFPSDLARLERFYSGYMDQQKRIAAREGYPDLNFRSAPQKQKAFFEDRGHEVAKRTATGKPSTDAETMNRLANLRTKTWPKGDPLAKAVLEYGVGSQTISSFLKPARLYSYRDPETDQWTMHTNIKQVGPVTGRMASADPNMMNIASETTGRNYADVGPRAREIFGPREGFVWLLPDYTQIEVWLFAFHSGDQQMQNALLSGEDFHDFIARQVWGGREDYSRRKSYWRKRAKLIMFCKIYGGGINKVATLLRSSVQEATQFVHDFDDRLPGVDKYMRRMINKCRRQGEIVNPFGRHYIIDEGFAYRSTNYITQGTAADVFKEAIIAVDELFQTVWEDCHIILPYHDELICEILEEQYCEELCRDIIAAMQKPSERAGVPVPLPVGMKVARIRWHKTRGVKIDVRSVRRSV